MTDMDVPGVQSGWGERLTAARQAAGLTQPELADRLGVSVRTVTRWEGAGRTEAGRHPDRVDQVRLANALGTTPTELFPRDDNEAELVDQLERIGSGCS